MKLTENQKTLIQLLKNFTEDEELIVTVMLLLQKDSQIIQMIEWFIKIYECKQTLETSQILDKTMEILDQ